LTVTVVRDDVPLATVHSQRLQAGELVLGIELRELVGGIGVVIVVCQDEVTLDQLAEPPHADHRTVNRVSRVHRIFDELGERILDRVGDDRQRGAGRGLELSASLFKRNFDRGVDHLDGDLLTCKQRPIAGRDRRRRRRLRPRVGGLQEESGCGRTHP
jgi:hypothetical protein